MEAMLPGKKEFPKLPVRYPAPTREAPKPKPYAKVKVPPPKWKAAEAKTGKCQCA